MNVKDMNSELIGILAKFKILHKDIAKDLKDPMSPQTFSKKLRKGFTQPEMIHIAEYLNTFDQSLNIFTIFFKDIVK